MKRKLKIAMAFALCFGAGRFVAASEINGASSPEPVPLTRNDMKRALDASKESVPRLPLPPITREEEELIAEQKSRAAQGGEKPRRLGLANNGRMRAFYLTEYGFQNSVDVGRARAGTNRNNDSSLDAELRTMLFWIVSRGNNCIYCLGHQESGLASRGMSDDQLAALDGDWSEFDPKIRAAFAIASKLSFEPYAINDEDLNVLGKHYDQLQVAEIILAVAGFNATNRWTGPLRIKQDVLFQFSRPTSDKYAMLVSHNAPVNATATEAGFVMPRSRERPPLETREQVETALNAARGRTPRLKLWDASVTKVVSNEASPETNPPQWMQLLAAIPKVGADRIASYEAVLAKGTLDPRTRAIIAYVGARHDRAWYALGHAIRRLNDLGFSERSIALKRRVHPLIVRSFGLPPGSPSIPH